MADDFVMDGLGPEGREFPDWPAFGMQDDVRPVLDRAMAEGTSSVLATLFSAVGGAPRDVGAQMLITRESCAGFLSGGCIEADVFVHALQTLEDGRAQRLIYGEGGPVDIRLPCGSSIEVLLERINPDDPAARLLISNFKRRRPVIWLTDGETRECVPESLGDEGETANRASNDALTSKATCGYADAPFTMYRRYAPPIKLVVVGSEPTALALLRLGSEVGFETALVRPFGPERPPQGVVRYHRADMESAFEAVDLDAWTAVAILTHDSDQEHMALTASLRGPAFYVGALGSQRRIPLRRARLQAAAIPNKEIDRIRSPIGLPNSGKSPWGIAVSIIAEVLAAATSQTQLG